ncbi:hypothetical protein N7508_005537 [Penicillium antarcticum]|uniref:uncharacterized protein n=1 Tax=Penicillium antarcticum TaxID=416450 RepID=UPI002392DD4A|nr:uncharacterized protein N7508_005537 [Penicillium antarcticum]KAJ5306522.1 hypothetical protein N7508_005537 [Penicillium antarcticum]
MDSLAIYLPTPHTANTSAAIPYEYQPRTSRWLVGVVSSPAYRGGPCSTPLSDAGDVKAARIYASMKEEEEGEEWKSPAPLP